MEDTVKQQRTRIYRVATLAIGVVMHMLVCAVLLSMGLMDIEPWRFAGLVSVTLAGFLVLMLFILMEWNLSFERPDMGLAQMLWAATAVIWVSQFATELRSQVMLFGLAMIVIGANRLDKGELLTFISYSLAACAAAVLYSGPLTGPAEFVAMMVIGLMLAGGVVLCRLEGSFLQNAGLESNQTFDAAQGQIEGLMTRDQLTGVYNYGWLQEILAEHKARADRFGDCFSVCLLDLDIAGGGEHGIGDPALVACARYLQSVLREVDCVGRFANDTFAVVLSGTTQRDAALAAERISAGLAGIDGTVGRISPSTGIADYRPGEEIRSLMERADRARCAAKRIGKTQVVGTDEGLEFHLAANLSR